MLSAINKYTQLYQLLKIFLRDYIHSFIAWIKINFLKWMNPKHTKNDRVSRNINFIQLIPDHYCLSISVCQCLQLTAVDLIRDIRMHASDADRTNFYDKLSRSRHKRKERNSDPSQEKQFSSAIVFALTNTSGAPPPWWRMKSYARSTFS